MMIDTFRISRNGISTTDVSDCNQPHRKDLINNEVVRGSVVLSAVKLKRGFTTMANPKFSHPVIDSTFTSPSRVAPFVATHALHVDLDINAARAKSFSRSHNLFTGIFMLRPLGDLFVSVREQADKRAIMPTNNNFFIMTLLLLINDDSLPSISRLQRSWPFCDSI